MNGDAKGGGGGGEGRRRMKGREGGKGMRIGDEEYKNGGGCNAEGRNARE